MIRNVRKEDAKQICNIYNYYVENTIITFEEEPVSLNEMENIIIEISSSMPWFVYEEEKRIIGYAYASKWKGRCAYRYSVEATVYVKNDTLGKGIGTKLFKNLLEKLKNKGIHAVLGGIALPNEKSLKLHEKLGFKKTAHLKEVGYKFNKWIDVGYWELIFKE